MMSADSPAPAQTPEELAARMYAWMSEHVPGYAGPLEARAFAGGQSNPTYQLITPTRKYVLRRKPFGKLLPSAHQVDREYRAIEHLHPTGFAVPKPYGLCQDLSVIGAAFYLMEMVDGRIFRDITLPDLTPPERTEVFRSMIKTLGALHNLDPAAIGMADFGRPGNYMARQVDRWTKQYRASETQRVEAMERLIDYLPTSIPAQERTTIVHGDYKVDNVVFKADALEIAAVLDWELSTTGDPICDVAYLAMNWVNGPLSQMPDRAAQGFPEIAELVGLYCNITGRDGLPDLNWYYAFNLFRLAAIIQGIVGRAREGTANSAEAASMEGRVGPMAETAWRLIAAQKASS